MKDHKYNALEDLFLIYFYNNLYILIIISKNEYRKRAKSKKENKNK